MFAPGVSVCFRWTGSDGVDALSRMVDAIQNQDYPLSYINTTILVESTDRHLENLLQLAAKLNAAIVPYDRSDDHELVKERALDIMPSDPVMMLGLGSSLDRQFVSEGARMLSQQPSVHIEKHHLFVQSTIRKRHQSSCCAVIPTSIPSLMPRVALAAQSVLLQEMDGRPDVLVAYSFKNLDEDAVDVFRISMERKLPVLLHQHQHDVFPPALARNIGARRVVDRPVVFVDADMYLHPKTFEEALRLLNSEPCVVYVQPAMMHYVDETSDLFKDMTKEVFEERSKDVGTAPGTGAVVFVTQDVLAATHAYDERFIGYGFTDWDFTNRLPAAGFKLFSLTQETGIKAMHLPHPSRNETNPPSKTSEQIYSSELGRNPQRNPDTWGGIPVNNFEDCGSLEKL